METSRLVVEGEEEQRLPTAAAPSQNRLMRGCCIVLAVACMFLTFAVVRSVTGEGSRFFLLVNGFAHCAQRDESEFIMQVCFVPRDSLHLLVNPDFVEQRRAFVVSAIYDGGVSDARETLYHSPVSDLSESYVYKFVRMGESATSKGWMDLVRVAQHLRAQSLENLALLERENRWERVASLPIIKKELGGAVWVDASEIMFKRGLFVVDATAAGLRVDAAAVYPRNSVLRVSTSTDDLEIGLIALPRVPAVAREADARVGYFATALFVVDRDPPLARIIHRVVRPSAFVFYVDPSVPVKWRAAVRAGVESWNPAFVAAGFAKGPMRAVMPADADFPADYDAGDARFCSVSWAVSPRRTVALGPSVVDPRTGEIVFATVVVAHSWVQALSREAKLFGIEATDEHIAAGLKDLIAHEVGHGLGARHNFKGSLSTPFDKLGDDAWIETNGLVSSVMDYTALNFHGGVRFPQRPGTYDHAMIKYGYGRCPESPPTLVTMGPFVMEEASSFECAAAAAGPFATDEDGDDPEAAAYDLSNKPVWYHNSVMTRMWLNVASANQTQDWRERGQLIKASLARLRASALAAVSFLDGVIVDRRDAGTTRRPNERSRDFALAIAVTFLQQRPTDSSVVWLEEAGEGCATASESYCAGVVSKDWDAQVRVARVDVAKRLGRVVDAETVSLVAENLGCADNEVRCAWWTTLRAQSLFASRINATWVNECAV